MSCSTNSCQRVQSSSSSSIPGQRCQSLCHRALVSQGDRWVGEGVNALGTLKYFHDREKNASPSPPWIGVSLQRGKRWHCEAAANASPVCERVVIYGQLVEDNKKEVGNADFTDGSFFIHSVLQRHTCGHEVLPHLLSEAVRIQWNKSLLRAKETVKCFEKVSMLLLRATACR